MSAATDNKQKGDAQQGVNLLTLPVEQLKLLHNQLDQELNVLTRSMQTLKKAQERYRESKNTLEELKPENEGEDLLVPLNSSVYVEGQLDDVSTVVVDIGAGYFAEKSKKEAEEYFSRKMDYLKEQMEKLQPVMQSKFQTKQIVVQILQSKVMEQHKAAQAAQK